MRTDLTFDECEEILESQHYGHLACAEDGQPFLYPITYVYKYGYIYSHTEVGTKINIFRKNPKLCFQVERVQSGFEWESVMCMGTYEEITDANEMYDIHMLLADSYAATSIKEGKVPVSPLLTELKKQKAEEIKKHVIYRINIQKTTGKAERPKL